MGLDQLLNEADPIVQGGMLIGRAKEKRGWSNILRGRETGCPARAPLPGLLCLRVWQDRDNHGRERGALLSMREHLELAIGNQAEGILLQYFGVALW